MSAILLLKEHGDSESKVPVRQFERDAKAGCNCDRWGHPCPDCTANKRRIEAGCETIRPVVRASN